MTTMNEAVNALDGAFKEAKAADEMTGRTGLLDDDGNVYRDPSEGLRDEDGNSHNYIWFRPNGGTEAMVVRNLKVSNVRADLDVVVKKFKQLWVVDRIDEEAGSDTFGEAAARYNRPDAPHELTQQPLDNAYLTELRLELDPSGDFNLRLRGGNYIKTDASHGYIDTSGPIDFSSYQPAEDQKTPVLVGITNAGAVVLAAGADEELMELPIVSPYFDYGDMVTLANSTGGADRWLWVVPILGTDSGFTSTDRFINLRAGVDLAGTDQTALDVPYDPTTPGDWVAVPDNTGEALDELADQVAQLIATGSLSEPYVHLRDQKTAGTDGGGINSGSYITRDLNTEVTDTGGLCSLSSNEFTLQAGTWRIFAAVPGFSCAQHQARLYNVTDAAVQLTGTSTHSATSSLVQTHSFIKGVFTLASAKTLRIEHRVTTTKTINGAGVSTNLGAFEVYTEVELWKRF